MKVNSLRLGIIFGLILAIVHGVWAALVAAGWAQTLLDFIFWAHFITPVYHVEPFLLPRAAVLVGLVFVAGVLGGFLAGALWNRLAGARPTTL